MNRNHYKIIVIVGAVLLAIGVFLPLVRAPLVGSVNYIASGEYRGVAMFALAVVALILALVDLTKHAVWPGIASIGVVAFSYYKVQTFVEGFEDRFGDGVVRRFVEKATNTIQMEWGWVALVLGATLILTGGALAWLQPVAKSDAGASGPGGETSVSEPLE